FRPRAGQRAEGDARTDAGYFDQQAEQRLLFPGGEAEQLDRVFTDVVMDVDDRFLPVPAAEVAGIGAEHPVADSVHLHDDMVVGHPGNAAAQIVDHGRYSSFSFPFSVPAWAWQIASASASAASSGFGMSGSPSSSRTISCTCHFSALPYPATACLICIGVYSSMTSPFWTAASMMTPRACPTLK